MRIMLVDPGATFSTFDVYTGVRDGLRALGHQVIEYRFSRRLDVVSRAFELVWTERFDRGIREPKPNDADTALWVSELAVTWALRHQPIDILIVVSSMFFHPDALIFARRAGIKTGILFTESPYAIANETMMAGLVDLVWTNERSVVYALARANARSTYLPHAFNPLVHSPTPSPEEPTDVPAHDVVFVGTGFRERIALLEAVDWTGIDFGLYGSWMLADDSPLHAHVKEGVVDNRMASALYRKAKIGLNLFRQSVGFGPDTPFIEQVAESLGPRAYELAACGCFMASEDRAEVGEVFGALVPTFRTGAELEAVIRRWLSDSAGREDIKRRLPEAVKTHTWVERARQLTATIESMLGGTPT